MDKLLEFYNKLPKTAKVFFYLAISTILAEVLIELKAVDQTLLVRILAQLINLAIVAIQESVPAVKARLTKK